MGDTHFPPNGWGCKCYVHRVGCAEKARPEKDGKIQAEVLPVKTRKWVNPKTGKVKMVAEGVDPSWDYNVGKEPWESIMRGAESTANDLYSQRGAESAKIWIDSLMKGPGAKRYIETLAINKGDAGIPCAVLSQKLSQEGSPILMLDVRLARKQLNSRKKQYGKSSRTFGWNEYQKLQSLLDKVEKPLQTRETRTGSRMIAAARDEGGIGYALIWEKELSGRNVLISFFRPGEGRHNTEDFDSWIERQKKPVQKGGR